jgi:hypothetical protein
VIQLSGRVPRHPRLVSGQEALIFKQIHLANEVGAQVAERPTTLFQLQLAIEN